MRKTILILPVVAIGAAVLARPVGTLMSAVAPQAQEARGGAISWTLDRVTRESLAAKIADARRYLADHKGARVTIALPAGTFDLSGGGNATEAAIDVSDIDACPGQLVLSGAGMTRTTVVKDNDLAGVLGRRTSCLTVENLTLMQRRLEASQGKVVAIAPDQVTIDIPRGFPTIRDLTLAPAARDSRGRARYWLKHYVMTPQGPEIVSGEKAVRWTDANPVSGREGRWTLSTRPRPGGAEFKVGDWVGIKAKSGGQAYRFTNGQNITFDHVRWVGDARGKFREVDNVTVRNCVIERPAPINGVPFLMATSGGGPQIGHTTDRVTTGHLIENNDFRGTGDDAIALANASGVVRNNRVSDANRGIYLVGTTDVRLEGNQLERAPVVRKAQGKDRNRFRGGRGQADDFDGDTAD